MSADLAQLVDEAREALRTAVGSTDEDKRRRAAMDFGAVIGGIGRRLTVEPARAGEITDFVRESAEVLAGYTPIWMWVHEVYAAAEPMESDGDLYEQALEMRSDLEFFRDLYRDTAAREVVAGIDTADTDARLERFARDLYVAAVPPDIPPHHVWWHRHAARP